MKLSCHHRKFLLVKTDFAHNVILFLFETFAKNRSNTVAKKPPSRETAEYMIYYLLHSCMKKPAYVSLIITVSVLFSACSGQKTEYTTFADYPGFKEYFKSTCTRAQDSPPASEEEKALFQRFRPRIILPSGGRFPVDFYRDYLPFTVLRSFPDRKVVVEHVTPEILKKVQHNKGFYLDFQRDKFQKAGLDKSLPDGEKESVLYGRVSVYTPSRIPFPAQTLGAGPGRLA
jgi:hypothetical protein